MATKAAKPGERVFAIRDSKPDERKVYSYGAGVYRGYERPPNGTPSPYGVVDERFPDHYTNPRIDLDRGGTIWGFQCWWGPEDVVRKKFEGFEFVEVELPTAEEC